MSRYLLPVLVALLTPALHAQCLAAVVTFDERIDRRPNATERAAGVPAEMIVHDYYISTTADVVCIDFVSFDPLPSFYQAAGAGDAEPPHPQLAALFPALNADTWITTPGHTEFAGGLNAAESAWFDFDDDGPQNHFLFARLTSSSLFTFNFNVVAHDASGGGQSAAFSLGFPSDYVPPPLDVPEPETKHAFAAAALAILLTTARIHASKEFADV